MTLALQTIAIPKTARTVESKYPFAQLTVGGPAIVDKDVIDVHKAKSRMSSALVAYKKRTGDKSKFSVRAVKAEDNTDIVCAWKVADAPVAA